ncbi:MULTISPECIES: glycosyltransferase family 39 protein [unclassified Pseudomonas]|uniref:glycosyltransferase family 39 protein n=1 Tax=unclassified Pseudomonas TaxID=196821 RepID=UPI001F55B4F9|nr:MULTISPECIES: glycosyltransferase family 39 protein [unclassified Pseudomonas]
MSRVWKGFSSSRVMGVAHAVIRWQLFFALRYVFYFSEANRRFFFALCGGVADAHPAKRGLPKKHGHTRMSAISRIRFFTLLVAVLLLATAIRFYKLDAPYMWSDEAFSVLLSRASPPLIWYHTSHDVHPPLYYIVLHYWMAMWGEGVEAVRSLSALLGIATVALGVFLTRLVSHRHTAIMAGLLLALSPMAVRYSQEARMYALMALLLMGATIALIHWAKAPNNQRWLAVYVVLMIAGFYTHYFTALCVVAHWCYLLLVSIRGKTSSPLHYRTWWWANVCIVLAYGPWLYSLLDLLTHTDLLYGEGGVSWIEKSSVYTLPSSVWRTLIASKGLTLFWGGYWLLPLVLVYVAVRNVIRDKSASQAYGGLVIFVFVPLLLTFLISLFMSVFVERYVIFSLVALPLVIALIIEKFPLRAVRWGIVLGVLLLEISGLSRLYQQHEDFDGSRIEIDFPIGKISDYIFDNAMPGDQVVVKAGVLQFSVIYYSRMAIAPRVYIQAGAHYRPSGYGSSTVLYTPEGRNYLYDFAGVYTESCRIWWVRERESSVLFPPEWKLLRTLTMGYVHLSLYQNSTSSNCAHNGG